jgi:RNA polymerase sigma factor (sigma-70 family)
MTRTLFNETINGASLIQIHDTAYKNVVRAYHQGGSVYVSRDDLNDIAWNATMTVYEKREEYVKEDKNICGLACTIAYNDLMTHLKRSMKKNMAAVPMESINTEKGYYNTADIETGRKYTYSGIGVGRELDDTFGEGMEIIEREVNKLSELDREIYEMSLDGVPQKEIARICNISHSNVRKRWHEIRKRLLKNEYISNRAHEMGLVA